MGVHVGEAGVRIGDAMNGGVNSLFVDLEPSVIDSLPGGGKSVVCGKEDAANNFARGYCTLGRTIIHQVCEKFGRMMEACDHVQGIIMTHSTGGGTGSGVGALIAEKLSDEYPKVSAMGFQVIPAPQISSTIVEPYNTTLCHHFMMDHMETKVMLDNEAMYDLSMFQRGMERPSYSDLNHMVAKVVSAVQTHSFKEYYTNLIPYPRIHYVTCAYAPMTTSPFETPSPYEITRDVLQLKNRMLKVYGKPGKWISAYVMYKGGVTVNEVNSALQKSREKVRIPFVEWSPAGIKCAIDDEEQVGRAEATLLVNDTVVKEAFMRNNRRFDKMWNKGAFVHWYMQEGMETGEFIEAQENMAALELDYKEMEME